MARRFILYMLCALGLFNAFSAAALAAGSSSTKANFVEPRLRPYILKYPNREALINAESPLETRLFGQRVWLPLADIPRGSVIYTPKSFDKAAYEAASNIKRSRISGWFFTYFYDLFTFSNSSGEQLNGGETSSITNSEAFDIAWSSAGDTYGDILCGYRSVDYVNPPSPAALGEAIPRYGLAIYYKDRGEEKREADKAALKWLINSYDGPSCKVLLVPGKYAMNDLIRIRDDIRRLITGESSCNVSNGSVILYLPGGLKSNPRVKEYLKSNSCKDIVTVTNRLNPGT